MRKTRLTNQNKLGLSSAALKRSCPQLYRWENAVGDSWGWEDVEEGLPLVLLPGEDHSLPYFCCTCWSWLAVAFTCLVPRCSRIPTGCYPCENHGNIRVPKRRHFSPRWGSQDQLNDFCQRKKRWSLCAHGWDLFVAVDGYLGQIWGLISIKWSMLLPWATLFTRLVVAQPLS